MIDEEFDLVLPSGFSNDVNKLVDYRVTLPHVMKLNPKRRWEMALLQMTLPDRGLGSLHDQYWFTLSYKFTMITDPDGKVVKLNENDNCMQKIYLSKEAMETKDNMVIFKEFKQLFNERVLNYEEFGYTIKDAIEVHLLNGRIEFLIMEDLGKAGNWDVPGEELSMLQSASIVMNFSRPLAYFLGLEEDLELTPPPGKKLNLSVIKAPKYQLHDNIFPGQIMTLYPYKMETNNQSVIYARVKCARRIKDGIHINPESAINVECDILESNYLAGLDKKRVLRKFTFYDTKVDTYVKYFEPKSIIFTPIENLQFQQISIKLMDDEDNPIKLTSFYSPKQYIGETSITVKIRPVI